MYNENGFWVSVWFIVAVVIITIASLVYVGATDNLKIEQQKYDKCIEAGGSWIPGYREAICLRK